MTENDTTQGGSKESQKGQELKFRYVKSNFFRVIHADGAWGGISPRGNIHISFYNERGALPDSSRLTLSDEGVPVAPERFHASSRLVREFECDVIVDLAAAKSLQVWLNQRIEVLETMIREAQAQQKDIGDSNAEKMARKG